LKSYPALSLIRIKAHGNPCAAWPGRWRRTMVYCGRRIVTLTLVVGLRGQLTIF
jgi:hypothetical protein